MRCACFWNVDGDCIHKDTQNGSCGVEENVRQKAIEANNSADVKPEVGAQPPKREYNNRSDKIAWVEQAFFCKVNHQPNPKNVSLWMDRKNAVIAQLRAVR